MGLMKSFKDDIRNFKLMFPKEVKLHQDKDVFALSIENNPNPYVPESIRIYEDENNLQIKIGDYEHIEQKRIPEKKKQEISYSQ